MRWCEHQPEVVVCVISSKILRYFSVQTDVAIEERRPDYIFIDKENSKCDFIDIVVPYDTRVNFKIKR